MLVHLCLSVLLTVISLIVFICSDDDDDDDDVVRNFTTGIEMRSFPTAPASNKRRCGHNY